MHQQSSPCVAAFRMVHDATLGRETPCGCMLQPSNGAYLSLEDPDNLEMLYSAVRVLCLPISTSFEVRPSFKQIDLHTSTTINPSSAKLATWRTVSLLLACPFWPITNQSPRYTSGMHTIKLCTLQHRRQHHEHIFSLQQHRPGDVHCLCSSVHNAVR
jgi:hypothetical protein